MEGMTMLRALMKTLVLCGLLLATLPGRCTGQEPATVNVFAAMSLTDVMHSMANDFQRQYPGVTVVLNLGGSNTLRLQIEQGAPCDVFVAADTVQIDRLAASGLADARERGILVKNNLVVIGPAPSTAVRDLTDLPRRVRNFLSLADPETVPAGIYAKAALQEAGVWEVLQEKIAPAMDVRAALTQVEMGNADYGIVYRTDALASRRVHIVYEVPESLHPPIHYGFCLLKKRGNRELAGDFYDFLQSTNAQEIFRQHGFTPVAQE